MAGIEQTTDIDSSPARQLLIVVGAMCGALVDRRSDHPRVAVGDERGAGQCSCISWWSSLLGWRQVLVSEDTTSYEKDFAGEIAI